jgi:hypothetical protein
VDLADRARDESTVAAAVDFVASGGTATIWADTATPGLVSSAAARLGLLTAAATVTAIGTASERGGGGTTDGAGEATTPVRSDRSNSAVESASANVRFAKLRRFINTAATLAGERLFLSL